MRYYVCVGERERGEGPKENMVERKRERVARCQRFGGRDCHGKIGERERQREEGGSERGRETGRGR